MRRCSLRPEAERPLHLELVPHPYISISPAASAAGQHLEVRLEPGMPNMTGWMMPRLVWDSQKGMTGQRIGEAEQRMGTMELVQAVVHHSTAGQVGSDMGG